MNFIEFMNMPTSKAIVELVVFTFFGALLLYFVINLCFYIKFDRHLRKHHFDIWKLTHGTYEQRTSVNYPKDPYYKGLYGKEGKISKLVFGVWLIVVIAGILAILMGIHK